MKVRKLLLFALVFTATLLLQDCGSAKQYSTDSKRQSLMLQSNTDMSRNKKYHSKGNNSSKRKSHRRYSR